MSILKLLFGDKDRESLLEMIRYNADMIRKKEGRSQADAEYLSICMFLDDLATKENGLKGHRLIMNMLLKEFSEHHNDVMTYLALQTGTIKLKPEFEAKIIERHRKRN